MENPRLEKQREQNRMAIEKRKAHAASKRAGKMARKKHRIEANHLVSDYALRDDGRSCFSNNKWNLIGERRQTIVRIFKRMSKENRRTIYKYYYGYRQTSLTAGHPSKENITAARPTFTMTGGSMYRVISKNGNTSSTINGCY